MFYIEEAQVLVLGTMMKENNRLVQQGLGGEENARRLARKT
jgi:hypothetical protein